MTYSAYISTVPPSIQIIIYINLHDTLLFRCLNMSPFSSDFFMYTVDKIVSWRICLLLRWKDPMHITQIDTARETDISRLVGISGNLLTVHETDNIGTKFLNVRIICPPFLAKCWIRTWTLSTIKARYAPFRNVISYRNSIDPSICLIRHNTNCSVSLLHFIWPLFLCE